jgi:hypothetical protein
MLDALALTLVEVVVVITAKWLVYPLTLGRWRGEAFCAREGRTHAPAGALSFRHGGQRVLTYHGLLYLGLGFYACVLMAGFAVAAVI